MSTSSIPLVKDGQLGTAKHALAFILAGNAYVTFVSVKTGTRFTYRVRRVCCPTCKADLGNWGRKQESCRTCKCHAEPGRYYVSVLNGPDNERNYQYMGMLVPSFTAERSINDPSPGTIADSIKDATLINQKHKFVNTRGSKVQLDAPSAVAFMWVFAQLDADKLSDDIEIWHAGKCGKCGRKLTVPSSIALGIGPECLANGAF